MFQSVRPNNQIYILHKGGEKMILNIGQVTNQPVPRPKYTMPTTFGQPQETVVDLTVRVGNATLNLKELPSQLDIVDSYIDGENIVVSTSREAMNSEVLSIKQKSIDIINSRDFNQKRIAECDEILTQLNPEFADKQSQRKEMDELKSKVDVLSSQLGQLVDALMSKNIRTNE
jgi:hypothetical protein